MKREKVYIAGPVTGLDRQKVEEQFNYWKNVLSVLGYEAVSPIDLVKADTDWHEAMEVCLFHLAQCPKAVFIPGWVASFGASIEMEFCIRYNVQLLSRGMLKHHYDMKLSYKYYNKKRK